MTEAMLVIVLERSLTTLLASSPTVGGGGDRVAFRTMDEQFLEMDGVSLVLGVGNMGLCRIGTLVAGAEVPGLMGLALIGMTAQT